MKNVDSLLKTTFFVACEKGYYGRECSYTCGHCLDKNECFHTNGTCLSGCEFGYIGDLCKTSMFINSYSIYFVFQTLVEIRAANVCLHKLKREI